MCNVVRNEVITVTSITESLDENMKKKDGERDITKIEFDSKNFSKKGWKAVKKFTKNADNSKKINYWLALTICKGLDNSCNIIKEYFNRKDIMVECSIDNNTISVKEV